LPDQLRSIAAQTRLPDELVVCDDHSTDDTVAIVKRFAAEARFPVRLHTNGQRLGAAKNFENAIRLCSGDLIALADQDDVWFAEKLARLETPFASAPSVGLAFADTTLVDENLQPLGSSLWQAVGFNRREQGLVRAGRAIEVLLRHQVVAGATMMFRATFTPLVLPIPDVWLHDGWIALLVAASADVAMIAEPLGEYRQHSQQATGTPRRTLSQRWARGLQPAAEALSAVAEKHRLAYERLQHAATARARPDALVPLTSMIEHVQRRVTLPPQRWRRWPIVLDELRRGRYQRYSNSWRSAAKDLWLAQPTHI
jgi:hypothetical protein